MVKIACKGKMKTLNTFENYSEFFSAFSTKSLGSTCTVTQDVFHVLYGQLCDDDIPIAHATPCKKDVLLLHTSRASYLAYIWKCALQAIISPPSMADLGWEIKDGQVLVKWMTMRVAPDNIPENCGCRSGCSSKRCACVKAELKCTGLCGCNNCMSIKGGDNTMADQGRVNHMAGATYAVAPALLAILRGPALIPKKFYMM